MVVDEEADFAAYGSPQGGINGAPSMTHGIRQVMQDMLRPFKAVIDLGGARGVMMAYSEIDGIPSHVHPMLYQRLEEWGFDGFVTADDSGMVMLEKRHWVAGSPGEAIMQWFNAGEFVDERVAGADEVSRWDDSILRLPAGSIPEYDK
jgi:beta-glucosidase-like glycosyl hydrolase